MSFSRTDIVSVAQALAVEYLGVVLGFFRVLSDRSKLTAEEISEQCKVDLAYTTRWLEAAASMRLVLQTDGHWSLSSTDVKRVSGEQHTASVIQAVYSILIADAAVSLFRSGDRPGYEIVGQFKNLTPYYALIGETLFGDRFSAEILPTIESYDCAKAERGLIADYWGGNAYLLERFLASHPKWTGQVVGGASAGFDKNAIEYISDAQFSAALDSSYDIILANRVAHHFGDGKFERFRMFYRRLRPGGLVCVWDFCWPEQASGPNLVAAGDLPFLNLIEHIQGNHMLTKQDIEAVLVAVGFEIKSEPRRKGLELLAIGQKPV